ncbi:MAG: DUF2806 domain-containing protein [Phascolarctobacterium sp.]|nr:DUF2806 domain-containing protein [Phascolarctobacterium sp.]
MCDPNTALETIEATAKATNTLGKIVEKIFGPSWKKKQADAETYSAEVIMKMIRDNPDMDIIYNDSKLFIKKRDAIALANRADERKALESVRQQYNLESVIGVAEASLDSKEKVNDKEVDEDFITRLFNIAKDANKKEMQFIWGKILAQEVLEPRSFSLRTLETVRNLSYRDAKIYQKIVPVVFNGARKKFIVSDDAILTKYGIKYEDVLLLDDCGLINSAGMLALTYGIEPNSEIYLHNDEYVIFVKNTSANKINLSIGAYTLKGSGVELLKILYCDTNLNYIKDLVRYIKNKNSALKVTVHDIQKVNADGSFNYSTLDISSKFDIL